MLAIFAYLAVGVGVFFLTDAAFVFWRNLQGTGDAAVRRRLARDVVTPGMTPSRYDLWRNDPSQTPQSLKDVFLIKRLSRLIYQSGVALPLSRAFLYMVILAMVFLIVSVVFVPVRFLLVAAAASVLLGVAAVVLSLVFLRRRKLDKFEEQLPDALDLMVRSLKIGHPLTGAIAMIAKEMDAPIGSEFKIAYDEITYGSDVPTAIKGMLDRVSSIDLKYISMAVQIQQESGGNLVESLAKLSAVIRDRFRMFRKVKAITAEGRFSAWLLSFFPLGIALVLQLIRPDYYTQVSDYVYFPYLVILVCILLVVNLIAMRVLTTLKV
jgi:tight adherence protein B